MSDCSTRAFAVPVCGKEPWEEPEKPSLKRLAQLNGEPPWTLSVPFPEILPVEAVDFIGAVEMAGVRYVREAPDGRAW